ncbi:MAG: preprotein translocase subunit YajC [Clostridiales Family XIII bacterium]|jgi:preprotein translocase subunit YajC|nr:preprotein translocase subunit YajC [Clostridiales Family XIII bacterium]
MEIPSNVIQIGGLVLIFFVMYMILIRPQRKRDKAVNDMRNTLKPGDKVTTIGGLKGTIVRTNDTTLVLQVGADKVKMEFMRWAVSTLDEAGPVSKFRDEEEEEEKEEKKASKKPKKLGAKTEDDATDAEPLEVSEAEEAETEASEETAPAGTDSDGETESLEKDSEEKVEE